MAGWKYEVRVFGADVLDDVGPGDGAFPKLQSEIHGWQDREYELFSVFPKATGDGYVAIFRKAFPNR